jgi:hypothetical protein
VKVKEDHQASKSVRSRWVTHPPLKYRENLIQLYHTRLGHCGIEVCRQSIGMHYRWPGFKEDIRIVIMSCDVCQRRKLRSTEQPEPEMVPVEPALETVHVDLAGPFKVDEDHAIELHKHPSFRKSCYIMVMVDSFTKIMELHALPSKKAKLVCQGFYMCWVARYGIPTVVVSDQGYEFQGEFTAMLMRFGINHVTTRPYNPKANGKAESVVKIVKRILQCIVDDFPAVYPELFPDVHMAYYARIC